MVRRLKMALRRAFGLPGEKPAAATPEETKAEIRRQLADQAETVRVLSAQVDGMRPPKRQL